MTDKPMRIGEFAKQVNRSTRTILRWEEKGIITPHKTTSGQRYYTQKHINQALNQHHTPKQTTIAYTRVSSHNQKQDLKNQKQALETYSQNAGITIDEWIEETGSGLNFKRPKLLNLINRATQNKEEITLLIAHKDRLARFGYDLIEHIIELSSGKIIIMNHESLSPQEELVQDILSILHVFSSRLYGLRRYEKAIRKEKDELDG